MARWKTENKYISKKESSWFANGNKTYGRTTTIQEGTLLSQDNKIGGLFNSKIIGLIIIALCLNILVNGYTTWQYEGRTDTWQNYSSYEPKIPTFENVLNSLQLDNQTTQILDGLQNLQIEGEWIFNIGSIEVSFEWLRTTLNSIIGIFKLISLAITGLYRINVAIFKLIFA